MTLDEHYICQRAANAIISEIGPFRVSTDALQAINQFLDEFIVLLLTCSLSLDLSQIKSVVFSLLPSTLGKNAIVEAELEVKTFTETESIDYELYERMRALGTDGKFPLEEAVPLLREKCFEYCTLADKDDQMYLQKSIRQKRNEATMKVIISPIVAIYVTTVMEHIAEYLLTAVAMTAEHEETDYVRVKEVFLALIDDIQLGDVFHRMDLRDKMEKRAGLNAFNRPRNSYLPPPSPCPSPSPANTRKSYNNTNTLDQQQNQENGSFLDITFDDLDLDYFEDNPRKSTASRIPDIVRPQSAMSMSSNYTTNTTIAGNRKSTFHLFKNNRNSFSGGDVPPRADSPVYDPDAGGPSNMNFDDLIKSGGTVKVSLTPNRLRSIETKDELSPPPLTWERRSTSSPRLSAVGSSNNRPSSPLVRQNTTNSVKTTHSTNSKKSVQSNSHSGNHDHTIEVPKINARPSTPSSPLNKKSFSLSEKTRFENPRDAPLPPTTPLSPTIPVATATTVSTPMTKSSSNNGAPIVSSATSSISSTTMKPPSGASIKLPTPLPKLPSTPVVSYISPSTNKSTIPSTHSSDSISSEISSVQSIPSPITSTPPVVPETKTTPTATTTAISIEEPPVPRPTKSIPLNGMVIRRSSVSNKRSRDSLRSKKEEQQKAAPLVDEPVPTMVIDTAKANTAVVEQQEQQQQPQEEQPPIVLTEEPNQINERQVHFDTVTTDSPTTTIPPTVTTSAISSSDETNSLVGAVVSRKKAATLSPERPSSMVAKRASMVGNSRRRSLHESYATEKYHQDVLRQRGSVSVSIKQWDDILKPEDNKVSVIPPAAHRRSVLRQLRQQQLQEQLQLQQDLLQQQGEGGGGAAATAGGEKTNGLYMNANASNSNAVLDKVLKFERASSLDDVAHQRVSHMPRRERFLYLQQDPSAIERKSTVAKKVVTPAINVRRHVVGIDQGIQTDPPQPETVITPPSSIKKANDDDEDDDDERGLVDGDEEWFLQDDEWDEQEETAIVEWLLGE